MTGNKQQKKKKVNQARRRQNELSRGRLCSQPPEHSHTHAEIHQQSCRRIHAVNKSDSGRLWALTKSKRVTVTESEQLEEMCD